MNQKQDLFEKKKVIFLHIPKAGGSTLIDILKRVYTEEKFVHVWPNGKYKRGIQLRRLDGDDFDIVVGHFNFGIHKYLPFPVQYITVLRDPLQRLISHYNYVRRNKTHYLHKRIINNNITLTNYLLKPRSAEMDNGQIRMLINSKKPIGGITQEDLEEAKQNLMNFFIFGTLENWDKTLNKFEANLGWDNIPNYEIQNSTKTKDMQLSDKAVKIISNINKYDIALYNFVNEKM